MKTESRDYKYRLLLEHELQKTQHNRNTVNKLHVLVHLQFVASFFVDEQNYSSVFLVKLQL